PPTPLRQQRIVPDKAHASMASGRCEGEPGKLRQRRRETTTAGRHRREQSLCRLRVPDRVREPILNSGNRTIVAATLKVSPRFTAKKGIVPKTVRGSSAQTQS